MHLPLSATFLTLFLAISTTVTATITVTVTRTQDAPPDPTIPAQVTNVNNCNATITIKTAPLKFNYRPIDRKCDCNSPDIQAAYEVEVPKTCMTADSKKGMEDTFNWQCKDVPGFKPIGIKRCK